MKVLFQVAASKSAIDRWVDDVADSLPSEDEMVKLLHRQKLITQGHQAYFNAIAAVFPQPGD